jgi:hypothetical protein
VDDSSVVERFEAPGDPVRWTMGRAPRGGLRCASDLAGIAALSAPLLSHDLAMGEAGLITGIERDASAPQIENGPR